MSLRAGSTATVRGRPFSRKLTNTIMGSFTRLLPGLRHPHLAVGYQGSGEASKNGRG
jgi:hypothetical protein